MNTRTVSGEKQTISMGELLKANIRDYAMYIVLAVIFVVFGLLTDGLFLSPRNLTDLINQTGYVAVLAVGMTCILIIKHIDLSVGYVAGFLGAVAATLITFNGWPLYLVLPLILVMGILIGVYQGFLVSVIKVPAFVTTLAGQFIFRGLLMLITAGSGTIIVRNEIFRALSNGNIPSIVTTQSGTHLLTLAIGLVCAVLLIFSQVRARCNMKRYSFKVISGGAFTLKLLLFTAILVGVTWVLANYRGLPWTAVVVAVVLLVYNFILNKTRLGRSIYAIGGNAEAAELSGINVRRVTFITFCSMSMLAALSGILYTSRLASATPTAGLGFELDAIASSYIGGVAVSGGVGKVTNTIVGALVIMSLTNGMNLLGVDISFQYIVKGAIFILAVAFDVISRKK
ncbi:MAG TPA: sugar ABC transporter permease [Candidatus Excrementavichristensenella intestinipullorum]|nr:sugar ABC transporter permease [Candidatus Excrementavichristensenella intestinipullorum]